jgi:Family of unknown function (DUF6069)
MAPVMYKPCPFGHEECLAPAVPGHHRDMLTYPERSSLRSGSHRSGGVVDVRTLWTGGVVAAVIVSGLTIVGFLIFRGMLDYPLLSIRGSDAVGHASTLGYAVGAALAALLATAAMHFLLVTTPRPRWFFGWLTGVGTAIMVLLPLGLTQELPARLATATVNLVLGLAIIGLVRSNAAASLRSNDLAQPVQTLRIPPDEK